MEAESSLIFHPKFSLYFNVLIYLNGGGKGEKKIKEMTTIKLKSQSSLTLMLLLQLWIFSFFKGLVWLLILCTRNLYHRWEKSKRRMWHSFAAGVAAPDLILQWVMKEKNCPTFSFWSLNKAT